MAEFFLHIAEYFFKLLGLLQNHRLNLLQYLFRLVMDGVFSSFAQNQQPFKGSYAYPEKLIHIIGEDTQKAQTLDNRYAGVGRFLQNALVK